MWVRRFLTTLILVRAKICFTLQAVKLIYDRWTERLWAELIGGVEKTSEKLDQNIFNFLKYHSWPFISTQLCISHEHLLFSYCARGRSQSSGRRCGWPTPNSQGNARHYPLQISFKENNNHKLYLWHSNRHSIQIIFLMLKISPTWTFMMNSIRAKQIRSAFS